MYRLVLPYPPSVNHYWGQKGNRRFILSAGVKFREQVRERCQHVTQLYGELWADVYMFPPDRRKRDTDNILKATFDALQHAGAYLDDYQISTHRVTRGSVHKPLGAIVVYLGRT